MTLRHRPEECIGSEELRAKNQENMLLLVVRQDRFS